MTKLLLNPFFGWGWHKDGSPIIEPPAFWVEIQNDGNDDHPRKYYFAEVIEDDHILSGWNLKLTGRANPLTFENYVISGKYVCETDDGNQSVIVGYVAIEKVTE